MLPQLPWDKTYLVATWIEVSSPSLCRCPTPTNIYDLQTLLYGNDS